MGRPSNETISDSNVLSNSSNLGGGGSKNLRFKYQINGWLELSHYTPCLGAEKSSFQISASQLANLRSTKCQEGTFRTHSLAMKWCHKDSYSFKQSLTWVNAHIQHTTCAVVQWPDHHCRDDLVLLTGLYSIFDLRSFQLDKVCII